MVLYIFWALLPLSLLVLGIWGLLKPVLGAHGKEHSWFYFKQALFCILVLVLAIGVDQLDVIKSLEEFTANTAYDLNIARCLIYPVILVLAAQLQSVLFQSALSRKKETEKSKLKS